MIPTDRVPAHLPHLTSPNPLRMGLQPIEHTHWLTTDDALSAHRRYKEAMRRRHGAGVYMALESSASAQTELASLLREHLLDAHSERYAVQSGDMYYTPDAIALENPAAESAESLWCCSQWIADDLLLLQKDQDRYRLSAASLCSPSHWRLEEKFGEPLNTIHTPVPGYAERMAGRVEGFMNHLAPGQIVQRLNWSLQDDAELCQRDTAYNIAGADTALYYRTERQTLRKLPLSNTIVFSIRVNLCAVKSLLCIPDALPALFDAIDAMPQAMADYKGLPRYHKPLERLRSCLRRT